MNSSDPSCPSCLQNGTYGDMHEITSVNASKSSAAVSLQMCTECGDMLAVSVCTHCKELTAFQPKPVRFGLLDEQIVCTACSHLYNVEIPSDSDAEEEMDNIRANLSASYRPTKWAPIPVPLNSAPAPANSPIGGSGTHNVQGNFLQPGGGLLTSLPARPVPSQQIGFRPSQRGATGMQSIKIQSCKITIPRNELIQSFIDKFGSNGYTLSTFQTRTTGKTVIQFEPKTGGKLMGFLDPITNMVDLSPYTFRSKGGNQNWVDETEELFEMLMEMARSKGRMFEGWSDKGPVIIHGGNSQTAEFYVVKSGMIPGFAAEDADESYTSSTSNGAFRVIKPIKEYLSENPDVLSQVQSLSFPDNFNQIGRLLIAQRQADKISFEVFQNLIIQVVMLGASDPAVVNMKNFVT